MSELSVDELEVKENEEDSTENWMRSYNYAYNHVADDLLSGDHVVEQIISVGIYCEPEIKELHIQKLVLDLSKLGCNVEPYKNGTLIGLRFIGPQPKIDCLPWED